MATYIASGAQSGVVPHQVHVGTNTIISKYTITATLSTGDIIQVAKIPDGARLVDVRMIIVGTDMFDGKVSVGTRADHDQFIVSATAHGVAASAIEFNAIGTAIGTVLDVSDDATTRYTMVEAKASDSTSMSGSNAGTFVWKISYTMDQDGSSL